MKQTPETPWTRLVRYHLLAMQKAVAVDPPLARDGSRWARLPVSHERIVTGRGDTITIDARARKVFTGTAVNEAVYYGWPLVVAEDQFGSLRAAPLVITELEPPTSGDAVATARNDPYLNRGLLSEVFFSAEELEAADGEVPGGLPFGDHVAVQERIAALCTALGLDGSVLDVDALTAPGTHAVAGVFNTATVFRGPSASPTRALMGELTHLLERDDWDQTAARFLLEDPGVDTGPIDQAPAGDDTPALPDVVAGLLPIAMEGPPLNDSQEQALLASCTQLLTVVTGPPGTGKSQLVAAVVANQWVSGRTVLVGSTNNGAVDVAARRCATFDDALLIRTGNHDARSKLPEALRTLAARGHTPGPGHEVIRRQLEVAGTARNEVHQRLADRTGAEARLGQAVLDAEGLRTLLWGDPGLSPVHAERTFLHLRAVKAARARWFPDRRYRRLLALAAPTRPGVTSQDVADWAACEHEVDELSARLHAQGPADAEQERVDLAETARVWAAAGTTALRDTIQARLHQGRIALEQFAQLRPGAGAARSAALKRVLPYVPGWGCTALSIGGTVSLDAGLFDLLVIDEASQCSIAHVLPLAYRARRVVIVGDPNQLTPVVTLTRSALNAMATSVGTTEPEMHRRALSAGQDSAYTAFAARAGAGVHLLSEHYRCHPQIAKFFNEQFYAGALRILTPVEIDHATTRGLHLIDVPGATRRPDTGGNYNEEEIDAIVRWALAHADEPGSLGVVTPFAVQARLISARLTAALGPRWAEARRLLVGTAHAFQGEERDVMLFSTVLAAGALERTSRWVEDQRNLVNVAVSRAQRALVVFADTAALAHAPVPTLHALITLAQGHTTAADELTRTPALHSQAEQRLFASLARRGFTPRLKLDVEGYELDFALDTAGGPLNIEVDGIHHIDERGRQRRQDLVRDQILKGLGWMVHRAPAWRCLADPDAAADDIAGLVEWLDSRVPSA